MPIEIYTNVAFPAKFIFHNQSFTIGRHCDGSFSNHLTTKTDFMWSTRHIWVFLFQNSKKWNVMLYKYT